MPAFPSDMPPSSATTGFQSLYFALPDNLSLTKWDDPLARRTPSLTTARDRSGKTALHYCAENLTVGCAELLLLCEPGLTSVQDEEGYTTLHFAVISGNRTMVRFLVERGADVNCVDNEKHSCVHWATVCGELECMDILVSAGANPSTADIHGAYPIHYAAQMCGPNSEMGNDVRVGLAALRRLIELGVDVSVRDQDGRPPLLWAASVETRPSKTYCPSGSSDAILALVNAGADVSATDKDGLTGEYFIERCNCAASRGHVDCLETLVSLCGADVDAVDSNGCSALFYAVTLGHADCTQLLLKPAHCGAAKGQMETLKILWQHGANLYMRNQRGDLPLHEAVQSGRKDLVQWLLGLQPSAVNSPNNNGRCALHVAAMANSVEMCKVLMDGGAEVNPVMRNSKGQLLTPLDASLQRGNRGCAKYLRLHGALPFCKMTDRHDIDRWLEHSFNINKLHQTEQLCDAEAPMVGGGGSAEHLQVVDSRNVQTLETSVQTDSGYFESREYAASKGRHQGDIEAVTKQGTFIEGGRTLKQAIITNVYVRTSGAARVHQPKRKRKQGDASKEKGHSMTEGSEETEEYSSCEERKAELRDTSYQKASSHKEHGVLKEAKKHVALESSSERRVTEEVIVKKRDGVEGHIVKRITRRPAEGNGVGVDDVRVSGEIRDNIETTPEGFTSVTFSEQKSSEAGRASSEEDPRTKLVAQESANTRMLGDVPEGASKQPLRSPAVIKCAERFLSLLSKRRSRVQEAKTSGEQISAEARVTAKVEKTAPQKDTETVTSNLEDEPQLDKKSRSFKDKAKHALKEGRRSPARRSSSSGQSSSGRDSAVTSKKEKVLKSKGSTRSISQEVSKERRRKSGPVTGQKDEVELTARRTSKTSKHSVPGAESTSEPDQSSSGQSSPLKQSKQKADDRRDTKTRSKGDVSTKKSTVRPTKEPERRMSTRREDASSTTEGSDSRGVDETTQEPLKQRDPKLAPDAQEASGDCEKKNASV
ncbi:hypothetical protein HPB48_020830 [Haemaphysalis longicornis]|uniref:Uncharacterized protein n=1 Tax=Haemaphysalis longicornis TaxID=44386 RepID=A0A9J6GMC5_HAELO|nr:hypothetical protein HPB48_020830 [Haemaphysalis longicornis]